MATLAELQTWRDALVRHRASGHREIEYDGKRIAYKSDDEMAAAIQDLDRQIKQLSGQSHLRSVYVTGSKGV